MFDTVDSVDPKSYFPNPKSQNLANIFSPRSLIVTFESLKDISEKAIE